MCGDGIWSRKIFVAYFPGKILRRPNKVAQMSGHQSMHVEPKHIPLLRKPWMSVTVFVTWLIEHVIPWNSELLGKRMTALYKLLMESYVTIWTVWSPTIYRQVLTKSEATILMDLPRTFLLLPIVYCIRTEQDSLFLNFLFSHDERILCHFMNHDASRFMYFEIVTTSNWKCTTMPRKRIQMSRNTWPLC